MNHTAFFEQHRDQMVRRGEWTRAAELNLLAPTAWDRPFRVLLTRLSSYEDTSLSITHHYLYALVAALGHYPDRAFLPPAKDVDLWAAHGVGWLTGIQSGRSAEDFGLVAFSNAVTQELGNLLWFLQTSGFPVAAADRRTREDLPLVILGGANAPYSSILWGPDSPVDGVYIGEDRGGMEALFQTVARGRAGGLSKAAILDQLAQIPGFLVPGTEGPVALAPARAVLAPDLLAAMPVALGEGNPGKAHLAISGGCAGFCSFCAESWTRKPYTEAPAAHLAEAALAVKAGQGASRLDVFSFNFNMHADLYPLLEEVAPWFSALGLKSQRFDSLAADPLLVELEKLFGKTWFTCGLEGISDRIRRGLNKNLDAVQLKKAFAALARTGVRELKVFLIATGWEEEADYEEFSRMLGGLKTLPGPQGRPLKIVFSVTPLVRFPQTPLEFEPPPDPREADRTVRRILRTAKEQGFEGRAAAPAEEAAYCDLVLRPPTAEVYAPWAATILEGNFVYRDEVPTWVGRHWQTRLDALGWTAERLKTAYGPEANRRAPWARADAGVRRSFLEAQYGRNRAFQELVPRGLIRDAAADQALVRRWTAAWKARAAAEVAAGFQVRLTARSVAAGRDMAAAALARALMVLDPVVTRGYRGFRSSWWADRTQSPGWCALAGDDRFTLAFSPEGRAALEAWTPDRWAAAAAEFAPFGRLEAGLAEGDPMGPWTVEITAPWALDGQKLLTSRGLKHTLRKDGEGGWVFDFPPASLKKDWVRRLTSRKTGDTWVHTLEPGEKWDWRAVLDEGFAYPEGRGPGAVTLEVRGGALPPR